MLYLLAALTLALASSQQFSVSSIPAASTTQSGGGGFAPRGNIRTLSDYDWSSGSSSFNSPKENFAERTVRDFATHGSRVGFIRKVYSVFLAQMLTTIGVTATIMNNDDLKYFLFKNHQVVTAIALGTSLVAVMSLVSHPTLRYKRPGNLIALGLHTLGQSILLGVFCSFFNPRNVCLGTMHSLTAFLGITAYTFANPNYDLSFLQTLLFTASSCLGIGILLGNLFNLPLYDNIFSGVSAVLMATYVARDTQAIVRGKGKYNYGQKEYILAALALYQDLYRLFTYGMQILARLEAQKRGGEGRGTGAGVRAPQLQLGF
jgi:FtsH-binding integral membrane protein